MAKLEDREEFKFDSEDDEDDLIKAINQHPSNSSKSASNDFIKLGPAGSEILMTHSTFGFRR